MILETIEVLDSNLELTLTTLKEKINNGDYDDLLVKYTLLILISDGLVVINKDKTTNLIAPSDLDQYIKHDDYATQNKGGTVKVHPGYGTKIGELGTLMINKADQAMIDRKINETNPIVPSNLNAAVKSALSGKINIDDMTEEEQLKARNVIGAIGKTDLLSYVKNTDYPKYENNTSYAGVVKITPENGLTMASGGFLKISAATDAQIAERTSFKPITTSILNKAVKAALSDVNRINDMTDEEKANARDIIGAISNSALNDYIHNGVEIPTDSDLNTYQNEGLYYGLANSTIANKPENLNSAFGLQVIRAASTMKYQLYYVGGSAKIYIRIFNGTLWGNWVSLIFDSNYATSVNGGIVKVANRGIAINANNIIETMKATEEQIDQKTANYTVIVPSNLDYAVRSVYPVVKTAVDETLTVKTIYTLGLQTTLSLNLPSAISGDFIQIDFISGSTPTNLTVSSLNGIIGFDLIPEVNRLYSIYLDWGIIGCNTDGTNNIFGWRFSYLKQQITLTETTSEN